MAKAKSNISKETILQGIFWGAVVLTLGLGFTMTTLSVAAVVKQFESRKGELEGTKSSVQSIIQNQNHPNQRTIDEINKYTEDMRKAVYSAWQTLQKDQVERSLWPAKALGEKFMRDIRGKKPGDSIDFDNRETYRNFIKRALPQKELMVRPRRWMIEVEPDKWEPLEKPGDKSRSGGGAMGMDSMGGSSGMGDMPSMPNMAGPPGVGEGGLTSEGLRTRMEGVLDWPNPEIYRVMDNWNPSFPPYAKEIWYVQEDIWVYDALLSVIEKVNKNATGIHNATVKCIVNLWIGQQASGPLAAQSAKKYSSGEAGMDGEGMDGGGDMSMSMGSMMSMGGGEEGGGMDLGGLTPEEARVKLIRQHRYVDAEGQPLGADDPPPYQEFNRMPVCLRLVVDQTKIPDILVECANCPMPMDVLYVRFNPGAGKSFNLSAHYTALGSGAGGGGGGDMMGGGGGGGGGEHGSESMGTISGSVGAYGAESVAIEIYGVINIFNSPEFTPTSIDPNASVETETAPAASP